MSELPRVSPAGLTRGVQQAPCTKSLIESLKFRIIYRKVLKCRLPCSSMQLKDQKCACATKQVERLTQEGIEALLSKVQGWEVIDNHHLQKEYKFPNYLSGVQFVNQLAAIAEEQNHHPEIYLSWRRVTVEIYTHVVNGLTDNDFILAAKYDALKMS